MGARRYVGGSWWFRRSSDEGRCGGAIHGEGEKNNGVVARGGARAAARDSDAEVCCKLYDAIHDGVVAVELSREATVARGGAMTVVHGS
ncbi:unnamed protein product [Sphenostylis stenocarpa]|uniref:Uncharacterized protein n=1 Tax=Sphenostylis stenocarpa TaxID=92480 RepID=A0AA86VFB8_9FABA|nr:unnamed protein product [Sphenostylis stenocarpa]